MSTGKKLTRSSDDPIGMSRALELRASLSARRQETRNADDGQMWLNLADTTLQDVVSQIQRARELAVRGSTQIGSGEREAIAVEVSNLRDDVVRSPTPPTRDAACSRGSASGDAIQKIAGNWTYTGDAGQINRRVGENEVITVNVTGDVAFGFASGSDVFTVLDNLEAALNARRHIGDRCGDRRTGRQPQHRSRRPRNGWCPHQSDRVGNVRTQHNIETLTDPAFLARGRRHRRGSDGSPAAADCI